MRGQPELFQFAQDDLQRGDLARIGLAHDDGRVANGQRVAHVMDEFDRAGAIEEGEPVAQIINAGDIGLYAHRVAARLRTRIADTRAVAHRPLPRHASAARQYPLEKAGFSALKRPDDRNETRTGDAVFMIGSVQYRAPSSVTRRGRGPARVPFRQAINSQTQTRPLGAMFSVMTAPSIWRGRHRPPQTCCRAFDMVARTSARAQDG